MPTLVVPMTEPPRCPVRPFWRRLGLVAFVVFLVKGLLWLLITALVATGWIRAW